MQRMKMVVSLLIVLALFVGPAGALAQHTAAGSAPERAQAGAGLATYFPRDTLVYASLDVSAGRIETLDALLMQVQAALPPDLLGGMPLSATMLLDMLTQSLNGKPFAEAVRPWLGDAIAVGLLPVDYLFDYDDWNDDQTPLLVAAQVTDRGAASGFVVELLQLSGVIFTVEQQADYDLFTVRSYDFSGAIMVRDDVLLLALQPEDLPMHGAPADNLTTHPLFTRTLALLPGADYGLVAYVDTAMLLATIVGAMDDEEIEPVARLLMTLGLRMLGPTAIGANVLQGETLALDIAQAVGNLTVLQALGLTFTPLPASDRAFLGALPASTALIIQTNSLAQTFENNLKTGRTLVDRFVMPELYDPAQVDAQAAAVLELGDVLLAGLTGLSYARDLRPWLQGEFALFAGYDPAFRPAGPVGAQNFPLHLGAVFEVSEDGGDAARDFVERFGRELTLVLRTQGVQGVLIRTSSPAEGLRMVTVTIADPEAWQPTDLVTLAVATDGRLLVAGTQATVEAVLMGTGPRFEPVMPEVLPGASLVLYAAPPALLPLLDLVDADMAAEDAEALRLLLTLIARATISTSTTADGDGVIRATLTLGG